MISHVALAEYGRILAQLGAMMVENERLRVEVKQLRGVVQQEFTDFDGRVHPASKSQMRLSVEKE